MYENQFYMMENPFYYPNMTPEDYELVIQSLSGKNEDILNKVLDGKLKLKPRRERSREYIFKILDIKKKA